MERHEDGCRNTGNVVRPRGIHRLIESDASLFLIQPHDNRYGHAARLTRERMDLLFPVADAETGNDQRIARHAPESIPLDHEPILGPLLSYTRRPRKVSTNSATSRILTPFWFRRESRFARSSPTTSSKSRPPTSSLCLRLRLLFVLVILAHERRWIVHAAVSV